MSTTTETTGATIPEAPASKIIISKSVLWTFIVLWVIASFVFSTIAVKAVIALFGVTAGALIILALSAIGTYLLCFRKSTASAASEFVVGLMVRLQNVFDGFKARKAAKSAKRAANLDSVLNEFTQQGDLPGVPA